MKIYDCWKSFYWMSYNEFFETIRSWISWWIILFTSFYITSNISYFNIPTMHMMFQRGLKVLFPYITTSINITKKWWFMWRTWYYVLWNRILFCGHPFRLCLCSKISQFKNTKHKSETLIQNKIQNECVLPSNLTITYLQSINIVLFYNLILTFTQL